MPFRTVRRLATAQDEAGANWTSFVHKTGGPASFGAGRWGDLSMGAGTPKYNAYIGSQATATPLVGAGNDGIFVGPTPAAGLTKHLAAVGVGTSSTTLHPATFLLCDYLLHYPLMDGDDTTQQDTDNALTLPRYATGERVRMFAVCTTPMAANAVVTVSYTNQSGVSGRTSTSTLLFSTVVGCVLSTADTSAAAGSVTPFLPLQAGDRGVRSVQSVTLSTGAGGFFALVLCQPLAEVAMPQQAAWSEQVRFVHKGGSLPRVFDGAYLNFLYLTGQNGTAVTFRAALQFAWG